MFKAVRQRCPLCTYRYPYLLVCAEILALKLRDNHTSPGYDIRSVNIKLSMYGDDKRIFLDYSDELLIKVVEILTDFKYVSGLKVYFDKTKINLLGYANNRDQFRDIHNIHVQCGPIKYSTFLV